MVYRRTARSDAVRAASRNRLLEAARTLFARQGYDETTMQQIVAAADTSIGNAYFYFPNKERLLVELVDTSARKIWDDVEADVAAIAPGPRRIGAIIFHNVSRVMEADRDLAHLVFITEQRVASVAVMREISIARWQPHLAASYPSLTARQVELAATAIFGANRTVVERVLTGKTEHVDTRQLARDMVRWSLRALGTPDEEIALAVRSVSRGDRAGA
jgi:AcrR family transcriptional regulator